MRDPKAVNDNGCPLFHQSGTDAVNNFESVLAALPAALRAQFEAERDAAHAELDTYVKKHGYTYS